MFRKRNQTKELALFRDAIEARTSWPPSHPARWHTIACHRLGPVDGLCPGDELAADVRHVLDVYATDPDEEVPAATVSNYPLSCL